MTFVVIGFFLLMNGIVLLWFIGAHHKPVPQPERREDHEFI